MTDTQVPPEGQAIHEAGHAVFGLLNGKKLLSIAIRLGPLQRLS